MAKPKSKHPLFDRLGQGPLLADGGIGTLLYERGISFDHCFDELNLSNRDVVSGVHRDYLAAGASLITTNTFGGNRARLSRHGFEDKVRDINLYGAKIAREAREIVGSDSLVMGSIGPLGRRLAPLGDTTEDEATVIFREQVEALLEGGVDLFIVETMSDTVELVAAVNAIRDVTHDLPVFVSVTFTEDGRTMTGKTPDEIGPLLEKLPIDAAGANCSVGPQGMLEVLHQLAGTVSKPLIAMPNAGMPQLVNGRFVYRAGPDYFAGFVGPFLGIGVKIIGGCCGTTPAHIAAMRDALHEWQERTVKAVPQIEVAIAEREEAEEEDTGRHLGSRFAENLGRKFQVSVELDPPKGTNPTKILKGAQLCLDRGVDAVNIGDSPMARVRMSAMSIAVLIQREVGIETILHFCCRDRNLMGIQSDLIGANALGIRNILAITGDPPSVGDYPHITGVFDVDAIGLTHILSALNEGQDYAGSSVGKPTEFNIGVALNPVAEDWKTELDRFKRKVDAGAHFTFTQPLYELEPLERCLEAIHSVRIPVFLGLLPLMSFRHASFMHHEVPGILVPEGDLKRMEAAGEKGADVGVKSCRRLLEQAKSMVEGVYLMPSFGRYETCLRVVEGFIEPREFKPAPDDIVEEGVKA